MPKFKYTASDASGRPVTGWINAEDGQRALMLLTTADRGLSDIVLAEIPEQPPLEIVPSEIIPTEPVDAEPVDTELMKVETTDRKPADTEIVDAELWNEASVEEKPTEEATAKAVTPLRKGSAAQTMSLLQDADRLTQQGIPLGNGLRAIADELYSGGNAAAIRAIADRLDAGDSLHTAMVKSRFKVPHSLRNLLESGVSTGRFGLILHHLVQLEQERRQLWMKSFSAVAYPAFLLLFLGLIFMVFGMWIAPEFQNIFDDFGTDYPPITQFVLWFFQIGHWLVWTVLTIVALACVSINILPLPRFLGRMLYWVPLIGPIWRWHRLTRCTRLMALLTSEKVPLPAAIRIAAEGAGRNEVGSACRAIAQHVERGMSFADAADWLGLFPPSCSSIIRWGDENHALPEAFEIVGDVAKTRMQAAVDLLNTIACPLVLTFCLCVVPLVVIALLMPLIKTITMLS